MRPASTPAMGSARQRAEYPWSECESPFPNNGFLCPGAGDRQQSEKRI